MVCPFCTDQALVILSTATGTVERCPSCHGLFVPWDMLAKFSADAEAFLAALNQIQSQLFPTGRVCPHCHGRLSQGRLPGQDVILTLCLPCRQIWTNPTDLEGFDPLMAQALRVQIQTPGVPVARRSPRKPAPQATEEFQAPPAAEDYFPRLSKQIPPEIPPFDPSQTFENRNAAPPPAGQSPQRDLEKELREAWVKREADLIRRHAEELQRARETLDKTLHQKLSASEAEQTQRMTSLQKNIADLEKGRAEQQFHLNELKARMETSFHEKMSAAKTEYSEFVNTLHDYIQNLEKIKLGQENNIQELKKRLELIEKQRSVQAQTPVTPEVPAMTPLPTVRPTPPPTRVPTPVPTPTPPPTPLPTLAPAPIPASMPVPKPAAIPVAAKIKPAITGPRPIPTKPSLLKELLAPLKMLFAPRPKKAVAPGQLPSGEPHGLPVHPKDVPAPKPIPAPGVQKPAPVEEKPVVAAKAKRKSFFEELKTAWQPIPKKAGPATVPPPTPVEKPAPVTAPVPQKTPAPTAAPKPTPAPKPIQPKKKVAWLDRGIVWMPRILPVIVFLIDGGIDEDWGQAFLWAAGAWGLSAIVRMGRTYSSAFRETTLAELAALPETSLKGGVPVRLKGQLESPEAGSKALRFKDATGLIALNVLSPIDILPRLFGLIAPGQYPKDEFELTGWYRRAKTPFIEVTQARHEKTIRRSLVKPLRWAAAIAVLCFAILLLFVIE